MVFLGSTVWEVLGKYSVQILDIIVERINKDWIFSDNRLILNV